MGAVPTLTFFQKMASAPTGASARARHRARLAIAAVTGLLAVASVPVAVEMMAGPNANFPGAGAAQSFLDMMNYRSPGERAEARLQEKRKLVTAVLSERDSPAPADTPGLTMIAPEGTPAPMLAALPVEAAPLLIQAIPPGPMSIPPPFGIVPPGGSPPPGGFVPPIVPTVNPPGPPPPPPGAIPEPAAWLTMLLGFGLLGGMVRRRRTILRLG